MNGMKPFGSILLCPMAAAAHGEAPPKDFVVKGGPVLRTSVYEETLQPLIPVYSRGS